MRGLIAVIVSACILGLVAAQTSPVVPTPDPNFDCPNDNEEGGYFRFPGNCSRFYECANGDAWLGECPDGLYFDLQYIYCNFPALVDCENGEDHTVEPRAVLPRGSELIGETDEFNCTANMTGAFPHAEQCELFYDCWEETATLGRCTEGHLFDLTYLGCNYPENTDCGSRIRPNGTDNPTTTTKRTTTTRLPGTGPTEEPPTEFECPDGSDAFYPHPEFCCKYIRCLDWEPIEFECPFPLVWHDEVVACDHVSAVDRCDRYDC